MMWVRSRMASPGRHRSLPSFARTADPPASSRPRQDMSYTEDFDEGDEEEDEVEFAKDEEDDG